MGNVDKSLCLRVSDLACNRGYRTLFSGLEFNLRSGESVQLAGANGAGKTTLLKTLCGLRRPECGEVLWGDVDIHAQINGYGDDLVYIGHDNALNPDLTPRENLRMLCRLSGRSGPIGNAGNIGAALATMGLSKSLDRPCQSLSAGQRRRVALARLSLSRAPLWLLDEPAAALDVTARGLLATRITEHLRSGGLAIFTTHEPLPLTGISPQILSLNT